MGKTRIVLVITVVLMAVALGAVGCTKKVEPTDADVVKTAIQRALTENCSIIAPSIAVISKTPNDDGSWSYSIRYQCGGITNAGKQQEMALRLSPSGNSPGRPAWDVK